MLARAVNLLFVGEPADGRGIEDHFGPGQRRQPRGLRVPLVPADAHADATETRVERPKAQVAGSEIKLLVVQRIVRDVHLAVHAGGRAVGVQHHGRVVIQARGAAFEQRADHDHAVTLCGFAQRNAGGAGNRFRLVEAGVVLALARILSGEQLLQTDDVRPGRGRLADAVQGFLDVPLLRRLAGHLHQGHHDVARAGGSIRVGFVRGVHRRHGTRSSPGAGTAVGAARFSNSGV